MKVIARNRGYYGGQLREIGDTFEVPEGAKSLWFEPLVEKPEPVKEPEPAKSKGKAKSDDSLV